MKLRSNKSPATNHSKGNVISAVHDKLRSAGFVPPSQPLRDGEPLQPQLKSNLTAMPSGQLGKELANFTAATDYATYMATLADAEATVAEQTLDSVRSLVRPEKSGTVVERNDKTNNDPRVKKAEREAMQARIYADLLATIARNFERDAQAISREITRRGQELRQA